MATVADEEVVAGGQRAGQVVPLRRAAGSAQRSPRARPATTAGRPRSSARRDGHQPDDADRPRATDDDGGEVVGLAGHCRAGLVDGGPRDVATGDVGALERGRGGRGLVGRGREQERRRVAGVPHPAGGVQARGDRERHGLQGDCARAPRPRRRAARRSRVAGRSGAARGRAARSSGSRPGSGRRRRPSRWSRGPPGRPSSRRRDAGEPLQQERRHLEGDAAPGQAAIRVGRVGPLRH